MGMIVICFHNNNEENSKETGGAKVTMKLPC